MALAAIAVLGIRAYLKLSIWNRVGLPS